MIVTPDWKIGDVVCRPADFGQSLLLRIVCFFDRGNDQACRNHKNIAPIDNVDTVHLVVIWKNDRTTILDWPLGINWNASVKHLCEPENELLVLALQGTEIK